MQMLLSDIVVDDTRPEDLQKGRLYLLTQTTPQKSWPPSFKYKGGVYMFEAIDVMPLNLMGNYCGYARYKRV